MRPPVDHIEAPPLPTGLEWINVAMLRMDQQRGHPVLVEFWDCCRANSLRTLPYVRGWHERYEPAGLRVIGVHAPGFPVSQDPETVRAAVARLEIEYPVVIDAEFEIWRRYGNLGWPARYLFGPEGRLFDFHYGEGGYAETEAAVCELLGVDPPAFVPLRPEDHPEAELVPQSEDVAGPYSGPYQAGGVWGVFSGAGEVRVNGRVVSVDAAGCYELLRHQVSVRGELRLEVDAGVACHAVQFTPGVAPAPSPRSITGQ